MIELNEVADFVVSQLAFVVTDFRVSEVVFGNYCYFLDYPGSELTVPSCRCDCRSAGISSHSDDRDKQNFLSNCLQSIVISLSHLVRDTSYLAMINTSCLVD